MLPILTHTFSRQLTQQEKEILFESIRGIILEKTSARFIRTPDTLRCEMPFFVSRWNPFRIFDRLEYTFITTTINSTIIQCKTFHTKAIFANLGMGIFFALLLLYTLPGDNAVGKVSLYVVIILFYVGGLLWAAHRRSKKIFETSLRTIKII